VTDMTAGIGGVRTGGPPEPALDETLEAQRTAPLQEILQHFAEGVLMLQKVGETLEPPPAGVPGPELDPPSPDVDLGDLGPLLMKLKSMTTDAQLKTAREFIETNKTQMQAKHQERIDKLMESIEKADKAKKSGIFGKIFGWIAAGIAALAAVAACVATGGVAIAPCVGALMAVGMMVLQETGGMDKMMEGITNLLKDRVGEPMAQIMAALIITAAVLAVSLAAPSGTAAVVARLTGDSAKVMDGVVKIASMAKMAEKFGKAANTLMDVGKAGTIVTGVSTATTGAVSGYEQSESLRARADMEETQKFIVKLQQAMDEETDKIKELIDQLQSGTVIVSRIQQSEAETRSQMLHKLSV
jgi:hypothetical protein